MPPKRAPPSTSKAPASAPARSQPTQSAAGSVGGAFKNTYDALTARENQSVVRAVGMFGIGVALLASSYGEILSDMLPV